MEYIKLKKISLKEYPQINEKWVQQKIAEDTSMLGLGEIELKEMERKQPRAGRLDFLFQDDNNRRYEVELQLGKTDESHIIRTIEYWDIERKRSPQFEHVAVIVAEDITSRFLNVISLFNGNIPIIAIQMNAVQIENKIGLQFITVLDETALPTYEEDEEFQTPTDRKFWEEKATPSTVALADELLTLIHENINHNIRLKYNKFYIGLEQDGMTNNFVTFKPRKQNIIFQPKSEQSEEIDNLIEESGLDFLEYSKRGRTYRIKLSKNNIKENRDLLVKLIKHSFKFLNG
ncbi:hypothetical protein RRU94_15755 [Domibacillus sp. DTU_2020_1001157_1_SI_ALB_TIR_016]|uniref:hypothetical protein n=1 Tax=Domibacillus sp. DTU_2020_1001157_1_SI_ALB_TIR_016 TaxID=3077789 RepID=UPI0028E25AF6|nr:hypothetical protein [Domibacillus sp. DTU_2020_1001157_1_SI_ALB_TIR_016]WNS82200.1 hypothetical protein RRU94_15755 [Domibacillus sp. DTU_2020_1001157_1_SI_ALB_TIR_016]